MVKRFRLLFKFLDAVAGVCFYLKLIHNFIMGNCAGYCITEATEEKKTVTVEHQFNNPFKVGATVETQQDKVNEFEIEYGVKE